MTWFDMMVIPTDAPHPENSCAFLDYFVAARHPARSPGA